MAIDRKDVDYKKIGNNIKIMRITKGVSQIKMAKSLGLSQTHMSNIENGNIGLSLVSAIQISQFLECTIDELVYGKENRKEKENGLEILSGVTVNELAEALRLLALRNK